MRGHLDEIKSSGYIEGWAFDKAALTTPLMVAVMDHEGEEIAWGLANRFRSGLAAAGIGTGWCAFRLRAETTVRRIRNQRLTLVERTTRKEIHRVDQALYGEDSDVILTRLEAISERDPTIISEIGQLEGCDEVFGSFIKARGVGAFVRSAYVYVLGRPVDETGLALYSGLIRRSKLTPYELLVTLADSDEFRSRPRTLSSPVTAAFPFR